MYHLILIALKQTDYYDKRANSEPINLTVIITSLGESNCCFPKTCYKAGNSLKF